MSQNGAAVDLVCEKGIPEWFFPEAFIDETLRRPNRWDLGAEPWSNALDASDPFDLERFVRAQAPVFDTVVDELSAGRKRGHWMWFVFPQLRGLGRSAMANLYGIGSLDEARAYLAHPVLGSRLVLCTRAVLAVRDRSLDAIFGSPDNMKYCSSMTLFAQAAEAKENPFALALEHYCGGKRDETTLARLAAASEWS